MSEEQILVRVSRDGEVHAETLGMVGAKCLDSIALLEELLEAQTVSSAFTNDYSQSAVSTRTEVNDDLSQF